MNEFAEPSPSPPSPTLLARALGWLRRFWLWLGWLAFGALCARFILYHLPPLASVAFVLTIAAFCFPGWALLSILWGSQRATHDPELWLWGGSIGIAVSCWVAALEGFVTGEPNGQWVIILDGFVMVVWFVLARRNGLTPIPIRPWQFGERVIWQVLMLWILLFVGRAYLNCEFSDAEGIVHYPGTFGADFLDMVAHTAALGLKIPPVRFDMAPGSGPIGAAVMLLPAVGRRWMDPYGPVGAWVILSNLFVALAFAGVVYTVVRSFVVDLRRQMIVLAVVFLCASFYWLVPLVQSSAVGVKSAWWPTMMSPLVNHWAVVSPQTLLTLSLWFVLMMWLRVSAQPPSIVSLLGLGLLAGVAASLDAQAGWLTYVAGLIWLLFLMYLFSNDLPRLAVGLGLFIGGTAVGTFPLWWFTAQAAHPLSLLGFHGSGDDYLSLPARLIILFGPLLLLSLWGLYRQRRMYRLGEHAPMGVLALLGILLILHVRTDADQGYGVAVGGIVLFALLVIGVAHAFVSPLNWNEYLTMAAGVVILLGAPSVIADWRYSGLREGADDIQITATDWGAALRARDALAPDAVVQSWPEYGDPGDSTSGGMAVNWGIHFALHPAAAGPERPGDDIYRRARRDAVRAIFSAQRPDSAHARAERLGIEYLYAGPHAFRRFPRLRARLSAAPDYFEPVYEQDSSGIYRLLPVPVGAP